MNYTQKDGLSFLKRFVALVSAFALVFITIFGGISINLEKSKYSKKYFKENSVFSTDNVSYFLIDTPSWFNTYDISNAFSISYSFCGDDLHMEYDIGGEKLGIYELDGKYYGYTDLSDNGLVSISLSGDARPNDSIYDKDIDLLSKITSSDLSKAKIKQEEDVDGLDVVRAKAKHYEMILYLNKESGKCVRFEYVDKDNDNEQFKCYVSDCERISLPDEYYNQVSSVSMSVSEFCEETSSFVSGAMYMLQLNGIYSANDTTSNSSNENSDNNN